MKLPDSASWVAVATTIASGLSYFLSLIPEDIGKVTTIMGAIIAYLVIRIKVAERKKLELEIKKLEGNL